MAENDKPSEWAMQMSRHYAASSSAIRSIDAEGFAYILDAARAEGRREGLTSAKKIALSTRGFGAASPAIIADRIDSLLVENA